MRVALLILACFLCSGCPMAFVWDKDIRRDVSHQSEAWGGYEQGRIYVLQQSVYLTKSAPYGNVLPADGGTKQRDLYKDVIPATLPSESAELGRYPNIGGVVAKGTRLRAVNVEHVQSYNISWYTVVMKIVDGQFAGRSAGVRWISEGYMTPLSPDTRYLQVEN